VARSSSADGRVVSGQQPPVDGPAAGPTEAANQSGTSAVAKAKQPIGNTSIALLSGTAAQKGVGSAPATAAPTASASAQGSGAPAAGSAGPSSSGSGANAEAGNIGETERKAGTGQRGPAEPSSDDALLREVLAQAAVHAEAEPGSEAAVSESLAMVLFDRGNREAAKELLCDQRRYYDVFQASATPCRVRTQWSADKVETPVSPIKPAPADPAPIP